MNMKPFKPAEQKQIAHVTEVIPRHAGVVDFAAVDAFMSKNVYSKLRRTLTPED